MKTQSSLVAILALTTALLGACSTSGGKQEPMLNHASQSRDLRGNISDVTARTQGVFKDMNITLTGTQMKDSGKEQDLSGTAQDKTVSVELHDLGDGMTHVEVIAKNGALQWNNDYAAQILSNLVSKS